MSWVATNWSLYTKNQELIFKEMSAFLYESIQEFINRYSLLFFWNRYLKLSSWYFTLLSPQCLSLVEEAHHNLYSPTCLLHYLSPCHFLIFHSRKNIDHTYVSSDSLLNILLAKLKGYLLREGSLAVRSVTLWWLLHHFLICLRLSSSHYNYSGTRFPIKSGSFLKVRDLLNDVLNE